MKNFDKKLLPDLKIFLVGMIGLALIIIVFNFSFLPSLMKIIAIEQNQFESLNKSNAFFLDLKLYQSLVKRGDINKFSPIKQESASEFINFLKNQAEVSKVNLSLKELYNKNDFDKSKMIPIEIELSGGVNEIISFIKIIKESNYLFSISSLDLSPISSLDSTTDKVWQAKIILNSYWQD